jgi:hypothetical protein
VFFGSNGNIQKNWLNRKSRLLKNVKAKTNLSGLCGAGSLKNYWGKVSLKG